MHHLFLMIHYLLDRKQHKVWNHLYCSISNVWLGLWGKQLSQTNCTNGLYSCIIQTLFTTSHISAGDTIRYTKRHDIERLNHHKFHDYSKLLIRLLLPNLVRRENVGNWETWLDLVKCLFKCKIVDYKHGVVFWRKLCNGFYPFFSCFFTFIEVDFRSKT